MLAIRGPISALGGAVCSVALFFGLAQLVGVAFEAPELGEAGQVKLAKPRIETRVEPKRPEQAKRQPPPIVPGPQRLIVDDNVGDGISGRIEITRPIADRGGRERIVLRGTDGDVAPVVRAPPQYPPNAIARQIEGWVRVQFSVTAIGTVRDAVVVDSEPSFIFDDAALKAIARWRYNPKIEHGQAVERVGLQTVIRFELED